MPTRNFRELLEAMPADRQRRIEKRFQKSLAAMPPFGAGAGWAEGVGADVPRNEVCLGQFRFLF